MTELVLADMETVKKRLEKIARDIKRSDKHALQEAQLLEKFQAHLNTGKPANTLALQLGPEEKLIVRGFFLLTDKPTIFAANVKEGEFAAADTHPQVTKVREYARAHHGCETVVISAQLESDVADLSPEEAQEYLKELGVKESGADALIHGRESRRDRAHRFRARFHQSRDGELGRPGQGGLNRPHARDWPLPHRRPRLRGTRRRRDAVQV